MKACAIMLHFHTRFVTLQAKNNVRQAMMHISQIFTYAVVEKVMGHTKGQR